jgi:hypothetical protein
MSFQKYFILIALLSNTLVYSQSQSSRSAGQPAFTPGEIVQSLYQAYPEAIEEVGIRDGAPALKIRGQWIHWADGRLLPARLADQYNDYSTWPFYSYSSLYNPPLREFTPQEKEALNKRLENRERTPISRSGEFYSLLYNIYDKESAWSRMKTINFLGFKVIIHEDLADDLTRVEEHIRQSMALDVQLREYVSTISILSGFNWRFIDGTATLSNHSYGIAIDVIPSSYQGKHAYWRWFRQEYPEWYSLPWSMRYIPPESFVKAFEQEGFIWGGKWFYFDGIHFEYRPEILHLNGVKR